MKKLIYLLCCLFLINACAGKKAEKTEEVKKDETTTTTTTKTTETPSKPKPPTPKPTSALPDAVSKINVDEMKKLIADAKFDKDVVAVIETSKGTLNLDLYATKVPKTVANFVGLVEKGYYDGLTFHRVINDFMVQGGCPKGNGTGTPGYKFEDEFHKDLVHSSGGILSMANSGPATNGSQFFITHKATPWLNNKHSVFGKVQEGGMEIVNAIQKGDVIKSIKINK